VTPDTFSGREVVWLHGRLVERERELLAMRAAQIERDRRIAQLADRIVHKSALLEQAEANAAESRKRAGLEQRELQPKLDELLLSRDQAVEQKATFRAAETNERSQLELAEVHAKLEERESELAAVRLRLTDAEVGWATSKAEAGLVNMDEDRVMMRLMERMRSMEAEVASLHRNEKSIESMEFLNEG
jgi:hypothetical protein